MHHVHDEETQYFWIKRLFYFDFVRTFILFFVLLPWVASPDVFIPEDGVPSKLEATNWILWTSASEFLTNDGHVWGDFVWIATGFTRDLRGNVWQFSLPFIILLDYLWAFKRNRTAMNLRIANWVIAASAYIIWTVIFPLSTNYDYAVWIYALDLYNYQPWIISLVTLGILSMWLGVILIPGYLIYRVLMQQRNPNAPYIAAILSLSIPGAGQMACKNVKRGVVFLSAAPIFWILGIFLYHIPTVIWWGLSARDSYNLCRKRQGDE